MQGAFFVLQLVVTSIPLIPCCVSSAWGSIIFVCSLSGRKPLDVFGVKTCGQKKSRKASMSNQQGTVPCAWTPVFSSEICGNFQLGFHNAVVLIPSHKKWWEMVMKQLLEISSLVQHCSWAKNQWANSSGHTQPSCLQVWMEDRPSRLSHFLDLVRLGFFLPSASCWSEGSRFVSCFFSWPCEYCFVVGRVCIMEPFCRISLLINLIPLTKKLRKDKLSVIQRYTIEFAT